MIERSRDYAENEFPEWARKNGYPGLKPEVIYGDTDSIFVIFDKRKMKQIEEDLLSASTDEKLAFLNRFKV